MKSFVALHFQRKFQNIYCHRTFTYVSFPFYLPKEKKELAKIKTNKKIQLVFQIPECTVKTVGVDLKLTALSRPLRRSDISVPVGVGTERFTVAEI